MRQLLIVLGLCAYAASAQHLSIGAIGGINLTDDTGSGQQTSSRNTTPPATATDIFGPGARRAILGIKLEADFNRNWSIEFDALHRELKSTVRTVFSPPLERPDGSLLSQIGPFTHVLTPWEFPLLAKYRLNLPRVHPFILGGAAFRPASVGNNLSHFGFATGAGVELFARGFRISPSIRYTRWASKYGDRLGSPLLNQVEFLVGVDRPSSQFNPSVFGRPISAGVILGIGLGSDFKVSNFPAFAAQTPEANSGIYGLVLEAALSQNFAVEADGLYRPLHGSESFAGQSTRFAHLTWEFPVLLKYCFSASPRLRPFFTIGPSFRAEGNLNLQSVSHVGATIGGGIESHLSRLKIAPTFRYTHWAGSSPGNRAHAWTNQTQLLVAFTF